VRSGRWAACSIMCFGIPVMCFGISVISDHSIFQSKDKGGK
jgi:hypothetical protein